jgi:hypothetical protein
MPRQRGAFTSAWSIIRSFWFLCVAVGSLVLRASAALYQLCITTYMDKSLANLIPIQVDRDGIEHAGLIQSWRFRAGRLLFHFASTGDSNLMAIPAVVDCPNRTSAWLGWSDLSPWPIREPNVPAVRVAGLTMVIL